MWSVSKVHASLTLPPVNMPPACLDWRFAFRGGSGDSNCMSENRKSATNLKQSSSSLRRGVKEIDNEP